MSGPSMRAGLRPGIQDLVVFAAGLALVLFQLGDAADDPGLGWHLKTGEWILANLSVPREDPFLHSLEARSWISDQWLGDVILYLLYAGARPGEGGAWYAMYTAVAASFLGALTVLLYRRVAASSGSPLAAGVATLLAFKAAQLHLILRPVAFSIALFAVLLSRASRRGDPLLLAGLFALWCNVHPAFVFGLLALWLRCAEGIVTGEDPARRALSAASASIATLLNPYGWRLHESIFELGSSPFFMSLNREWRPPDPAAIETLVSALMLAGAAISCMLARKPRLFHIACLIVLTPLAARSVRVIPFLVIAASFPFADFLGAISERLAKASPFRLVASLVHSSEEREKRSSRGALGFALWLPFAALWLAANEPALGPSRALYPYGAVERLRREVQEAVIASTPDWGGFVTWLGAPGLKPLLDDRNTLIGEKAYRALFSALRPGGDWRAFLERSGATHLLLPGDSAIAIEVATSGAYREMYRDDVSVLFDVTRGPRDGGR